MRTNLHVSHKYVSKLNCPTEHMNWQCDTDLLYRQTEHRIERKIIYNKIIEGRKTENLLSILQQKEKSGQIGNVSSNAWFYLSIFYIHINFVKM